MPVVSNTAKGTEAKPATKKAAPKPAPKSDDKKQGE